MENIKVEKTIHDSLQQDVRVPISQLGIKKTGYNKHLNYYYYDLGDVERPAHELFAKAGICPVFNIGFDANGVEMARMDLYKGAQIISFQIPTAEVPNMNGIFNLGSKDKYCLRYLLVNHVLMLDEEDDAELSNTNSNAPVIEDKKATARQVEMIRSLYDDENIAKMLEYYGIETLEDMPLKSASDVISRKKK